MENGRDLTKPDGVSEKDWILYLTIANSRQVNYQDPQDVTLETVSRVRGTDKDRQAPEIEELLRRGGGGRSPEATSLHGNPPTQEGRGGAGSPGHRGGDAVHGRGSSRRRRTFEEEAASFEPPPRDGFRAADSPSESHRKRSTEASSHHQGLRDAEAGDGASPNGHPSRPSHRPNGGTPPHRKMPLDEEDFASLDPLSWKPYVAPTAVPIDGAEEPPVDTKRVASPFPRRDQGIAAESAAIGGAFYEAMKVASPPPFTPSSGRPSDFSAGHPGSPGRNQEERPNYEPEDVHSHRSQEEEGGGREDPYSVEPPPAEEDDFRSHHHPSGRRMPPGVRNYEKDERTERFLKKEYIMDLRELEAKGFKPTQTYTMNDDLHEMKWEKERLDSIRYTTNKARQWRHRIAHGVRLVETIDKEYGPKLHIGGFSEDVEKEMGGWNAVLDEPLERIFKQKDRRGESNPYWDIASALSVPLALRFFTNKFLKGRKNDMLYRFALSPSDPTPVPSGGSDPYEPQAARGSPFDPPPPPNQGFARSTHAATAPRTPPPSGQTFSSSQETRPPFENHGNYAVDPEKLHVPAAHDAVPYELNGVAPTPVRRKRATIPPI